MHSPCPPDFNVAGLKACVGQGVVRPTKISQVSRHGRDPTLISGAWGFLGSSYAYVANSFGLVLLLRQNHLRNYFRQLTEKSISCQAPCCKASGRARQLNRVACAGGDAGAIGAAGAESNITFQSYLQLHGRRRRFPP